MMLRGTPRSTWLGRLVRGRRLDRNPLRRSTDRAETVIVAGLLAAFAAAAPFAAQAAASWSNTASLHELQVQHERFQQVRATLLEAPIQAEFWGAPLAPQAAARWTAPDRQVRTGFVTVGAEAKAGGSVLIWTDQAGSQVTPFRPDQVPARNELAAAVAIAVLGAGLLLAGYAAHRALDRSKLAGWEAEWLATGPRWTAQR